MSTPDVLSWRKHVRDTLLSLTTVGDDLGRIKLTGGSEPAFFVSHLSHVREQEFPAISLHADTRRSRVSRVGNYGATLYVDVWCAATPRGGVAGRPAGESGCWSIYRKISPYLHQSHERGAANPLNSAVHLVRLLFEESVTVLHDDGDHVYHLAARYDVQLGVIGDCPAAA